MKNKKILILCKVIDNYGDIGVVYRLAKALCELDNALELTIVCSDLKSFSLLTKNRSFIDPQKKEQKFAYKGLQWTILDWEQPNNFKYESSPFPIVLECFQCGRPDWLEEILFSKNAKETYHIFNIEYLTAETYADDFHLLKSYTRSSNVKKMFFMPGFTKKTGALVIDKEFKKNLNNKKLSSKEDKTFTVAIFSYERSFDEVFIALDRFLQKERTQDVDFNIRVLAAAGKSLPFVKKSWAKFGKNIQLTELEFLSQEDWDKILCTSDFNFVRGEESFARAALCSAPFVWHAYIQEENYQLVKVEAFLEKLLPFIKDKKNALALKRLWQDYNIPQKELFIEDLELLFESTYKKNLSKDFSSFSQDLLKNGNLAENLLNYMSSQGL